MSVSKNLRLAMVSIAAADTGAGGLVTITGNSSPLMLFGNEEDDDLPVVTYFIVDDAEGTSSTRDTVLVQFTAWTTKAGGALYVELAEDMRDRVEAIMTQANLQAQVPSVDAAPRSPRRRDLTPIEGTLGLILEMEFFNAK